MKKILNMALSVAELCSVGRRTSPCARTKLHFVHPATRSIASRLATRPSVARFNRVSGFTLIELMVVVIIIAIIAAIAIPSYQAYARRAVAAQAQQEMQRTAALLERNKARNFSYKGFVLSAQSVQTYSFDLKDGADTSKLLTATDADGRTWTMKATTSNAQNYNFLMTSTGIRCKNKTAANISYTSCGTGSEAW